MSDEPTTGEIVRRLDALTATIGELVSELKADRAEAAKTYLRKDVYLAERQAANAVVSDLQSDIVANKATADARFDKLEEQRRDDAASRRQLWLALAAMSITMLGIITAAIINIVQG